MGVYAFGAYGVLIGPLVSGALLALIDIYKQYLVKNIVRKEYIFLKKIVVDYFFC